MFRFQGAAVVLTSPDLHDLLCMTVSPNKKGTTLADSPRKWCMYALQAVVSQAGQASVPPVLNLQEAASRGDRL